MKTLIVYDSDGNIVFTQGNANKDNYRLTVADIDDNKEILGVDPTNGKIILGDKISKTQLDEMNDKLNQTNAKIQEAMTAIDIMAMRGVQNG